MLWGSFFFFLNSAFLGCTFREVCSGIVSDIRIFVVVQSLSCVRLCDPMDCSTPGFPVLHHLPELAQTPVHWVSDAIQPSHPPSLLSPPAFSLSQHQGLFQWVSSLHQVAKVLEFMCVLVAQSCLTLYNAMDCSPYGRFTLMYSRNQHKIVKRLSFN